MCGRESNRLDRRGHTRAAKVTVTNTETSFVSNGVTGSEGAYYIPYLAPGTYRLVIEAGGFKRYVREGIVLRINEQPRIDVQMELGNVSESIEVTGAAPLLETETSATGGILEGNTIVKIPVLQKYAFRILLYLPSTANINGQHVVGQRERAIGYTLDGVSGKEPVRAMIGSTNQVTSTTIDALQEVKLWTTGMPAEFGHSAGGLLSGVFKSGTNQLHGSAEDRYINRIMIHRTRLERLARTNPFTYHEMSATASGPIYIPKLYNGKDRTFLSVRIPAPPREGRRDIYRQRPERGHAEWGFQFWRCWVADLRSFHNSPGRLGQVDLRSVPGQQGAPGTV